MREWRSEPGREKPVEGITKQGPVGGRWGDLLGTSGREQTVPQSFPT